MKNKIEYRFYKDDDLKIHYEVEYDVASVSLPTPRDEELPEWTKLGFKQCPGCPYQEDTVPHCPVAANIHKLVEHFCNHKSTDTYYVSVQTKNRTISTTTDLQTALRSVLGLVMALSKCSRMDFLKPMAFFHLPFSSIEETMFRAMGNFLISEMIDGNLKQDELQGKLVEKYERLNELNSFILERIRSIEDRQDADLNAIVILDSLAIMLSMEMSSDYGSIVPIFKRNSE